MLNSKNESERTIFVQKVKLIVHLIGWFRGGSAAEEEDSDLGMESTLGKEIIRLMQKAGVSYSLY